MIQFRFGIAAFFLAGVLALAADPPKDDKSPVLVDAGGKEVVLKKWKITGGTKKVAWLADKPECFVVRELGSTSFVDGVQTFIPIQQVQAIRYDYDKLTATIQVAGLEKPLEGSIRFKDMNSLVLDAEIDQGKSGVADLKYRGGVVKVGYKEVKFPDAKAATAPPAKGDPFSFLIVPEGKGKTPHIVMTASNVQALYRFGDGSEKRLSFLMFKKTLKVELATIEKMHVGVYDVKEKTAECEVRLKDGMQLSVSLLTSVTVDGKTATLIGLAGEVPGGWKLFPIHTISEFQPGELKVEEKKEEPKKKELPKKKEES